MKKLLTFFIIVFMSCNLFAGGLITNVNQSAAWLRLPNRNASVGFDAVYFNPAGLMKLNNGFHFSVSNLTIFQSRVVENDYKGPGDMYGLNQHVYHGTVNAPVYPCIYATYKMDKFAFSLGFNPIGGGGGAEFKKGLPSLELSASDLVPQLAAMGADAYKLDAYFKGNSIFLGYQGNVSYKVNNWLSLAIGLRFVSAKNSYKGHLNDIEVELPSGWTKADAIMTGIAGNATTAASATTNLVSAGAGTLTLAQVESMHYISAAQEAQLEGALVSFGYPAATPIAQADAIFKGAAAKYTATATLLGDQSADVTQTGTGIAPILSVNISPSDKLNIAFKYEMRTQIELKNKTKKDFTVNYDSEGKPVTMFPDGQKNRSDIPAMIAFGIDYKLTDRLLISLGTNYFFDKNADYGHKVDDDLNSATPTVHISNKDIFTENGYTLQGGFEYKVTSKLLLSTGYYWANQGANSKYQSDITYGLGSQTFGIGGAYLFSDKLQLNFGFSDTEYRSASKLVDHKLGTTTYSIPESYGKNTKMFALGLDFSF